MKTDIDARGLLRRIGSDVTRLLELAEPNAPPDPGPGWRLLDEGETVNTTDEAWPKNPLESPWPHGWIVTQRFGPQTGADWYRRPLPSAPAGWELVESGEVREGDTHTISGSVIVPSLLLTTHLGVNLQRLRSGIVNLITDP